MYTDIDFSMKNLEFSVSFNNKSKISVMKDLDV